MSQFESDFHVPGAMRGAYYCILWRNQERHNRAPEQCYVESLFVMGWAQLVETVHRLEAPFTAESVLTLEQRRRAKQSTHAELATWADWLRVPGPAELGGRVPLYLQLTRWASVYAVLRLSEDCGLCFEMPGGFGERIVADWDLLTPPVWGGEE